MNVHNVLVGILKDCSYSCPYGFMLLNMCDIIYYVKGLLISMETLTHINDDLVNGVTLRGVS